MLAARAALRRALRPGRALCAAPDTPAAAAERLCAALAPASVPQWLVDEHAGAGAARELLAAGLARASPSSACAARGEPLLDWAGGAPGGDVERAAMAVWNAAVPAEGRAPERAADALPLLVDLAGRDAVPAPAQLQLLALAGRVELSVLGDAPAAVRTFDEALAAAEALFGADGAGLPAALHDAGSVRAATGDHAGAAEHFRRAVDLIERHHGAAHEALPPALGSLAAALGGAGDLPGKRAALERVAALEGVDEEFAERAELDLVSTMLQQRADVADAGARAAALLARARARLGAQHPDLVLFLSVAADAAEAAGDAPAWRDAIAEAHALCAASAPDHPGLPLLALSLARAEGALGNRDELRRLAQEFVDAHSDEEDPRLLPGLMLLAEAAGDDDAAKVKHLEHACDILGAAGAAGGDPSSSSPLEHVMMLTELGKSYLRLGRKQDVRDALEAAAATAAAGLPAGHLARADADASLGATLVHEPAPEDKARARELLRAALDARVAAGAGAGNMAIGLNRMHLALAEGAAGNADEAQALLRASRDDLAQVAAGAQGEPLGQQAEGMKEVVEKMLGSFS